MLSREKSGYRQLTAIYDAIHMDDVAALQGVLAHFDLNQAITIYEHNYKPASSVGCLSKQHDTTRKTILEIAAAKGRANCVEWLLQQNIDKTSLGAYATCQNPDTAGLKRFLDDKSNYTAVGRHAITVLRQMTPVQQKQLTDSIKLRH